MPVPGNTTTPMGKDVEHLVVALERRGLGVTGPVRLERHLRDLADVGQLLAISSAPFRDPPCSSTMSACLECTRASAAQIVL